MPGRLEYERAIRRSDLPPPSRHLALTIATWADIDTGIIPDRWMPALPTLEEATGLSHGAVLKHLKTLQAGGWLRRISGGGRNKRTVYRLDLPAGDETGHLVTPSNGSPDDLKAGKGSPRDPETGHDVTQNRSRRDPKSPRSPTESQDSAFNTFWDAYPRKIAKGAARTAWTKALKRGADPEHLTEAARTHTAAWQAKGTDPQYIPHAATWLNGERYDDAPEPTTPPRGQQPAAYQPPVF